MSITVNRNPGDPVTAGDQNNDNAWWDGTARTYTPALTAATTNPTLGTGSVVAGRYRQVGKQVFGEIRILFGTSGAAAGSGAYFVSLPVTGVFTGNGILGQGFVMCAGLWTPIKMQWNNSTSASMRYITAAVNGSKTALTNALPGVFTNNDEIDLTFAYEAA